MAQGNLTITRRYVELGKGPLRVRLVYDKEPDRAYAEIKVDELIGWESIGDLDAVERAEIFNWVSAWQPPIAAPATKGDAPAPARAAAARPRRAARARVARPK